MSKLDRRKFLKLLGAGSGAVALSTILPNLRVLNSAAEDVFTFRAVTGLPANGLPSYASLVVEGVVNLKAKSGFVSKTVFAGYPEAMSTIVWPGFSRVIRVTGVDDSNTHLKIDGVVDDPSHLVPGESPNVSILIDRFNRVARTPFINAEMALRIEH